MSAADAFALGVAAAAITAGYVLTLALLAAVAWGAVVSVVALILEVHHLIRWHIYRRVVNAMHARKVRRRAAAASTHPAASHDPYADRNHTLS